jgi:DNA modification methylase
MSEVRHRSRPAQSAAPVALTSSAAEPALAWAQRQDLTIVYRRIDELRPAERNTRTHSRRQVQQIAAAMREFGFTNPILIDDNDQIVAGHGRLEAAKLLGLAQVPTIRLAHLTKEQKRAYVIADNRLAELAGWDRELLALELKELIDLDISFEVEITGWTMGEIDVLVDGPAAPQSSLDEVEEPKGPAVTRKGDLWLLGRHRLLCGDARERSAYETLMAGESAQMIFTDPPWNLAVKDISGLGRIQHREFVMASGELSQAEFTGFLKQVLANLAAASADGSIHFVAMDWRHLYELLSAGRDVYTEFKQLVVWNKDNGGMGSFYRSKHELVAVFKKGTRPHVNNFLLGERGRYRTNVWDYPGVNTRRPGRSEDLAMHPTAKPVAMVADAIRDCSKRGGIILDAFSGSGSTLIAAEKTGRRAHVMELDELYVDVAVRRWQRVAGEIARLAATGLGFDETARQRVVTSAPETTGACHD